MMQTSSRNSFNTNTTANNKNKSKSNTNRSTSPTNVIITSSSSSENLTLSAKTSSFTSEKGNEIFNTSTMSDSTITVKDLDQQLQEVISRRDNLRQELENKEKELKKVFSDMNGMKKPRESLDDLDKQIKKLEVQRETNSMPLAQEREILKQIYKLNKSKEVVQEYNTCDTNINTTKEAIKSLKQSLRDTTLQINETRLAYETAKTAQDLGCHITELVGTKVSCPSDKLGRVIGKNGKNMKNIQDTAKVDVNIVVPRSRKSSKDYSDMNSNITNSHSIDSNNSSDDKSATNKTIHIIGTYDSLHIAKTNIDNVLSKTEYEMDVSDKLMAYLTAKNITYLSTLRQKYGNENTYDTYCLLHRKSGTPTNTPTKDDNNNKSSSISIRGIPTHIDLMKHELIQLSDKLVEKTITDITYKESGLIIGKNGTNIEKLVTDYQVVIDVQQQQRSISSDEGKDDDKDDNGSKRVIITLIGMADNVINVSEVLHDMINDNRESVHTIPSTQNVKDVLLMKSGSGVQALAKKVNELITKLVKDNNEESTVAFSSTYVNLSFVNEGIAIRCKNKFMKHAIPIVQEEVRRIHDQTIAIPVDPIVIPVLIGKGGETMKRMREINTSVAIDIDRVHNKIVISGMNIDDMNRTSTAVKDVLHQNQIERISMDVDKNHIQATCRDLLRLHGNEIRSLVFIIFNEKDREIVLRGEYDKIQQAKGIVHEFLQNNYMEELTVTKDDMIALITGGKNSKVVEIGNNHHVSLRSDRDNNIIIGKGLKSNVQTSLRHIREFLYGSDSVIVQQIQLLNDEMLGFIIGKGGKTKKDLEMKYNTVSIRVNDDTTITLRGPKDDVYHCQLEILKLTSLARISRTYTITNQSNSSHDKKKKSVTTNSPAQPISFSINNQNKLKQTLSRTVFPLQIQFSSDYKDVTYRGTYDNVQTAMSITKEFVEGTCESRIIPGTLNNACILFKRIKESCSVGNSSYVTKIEKDTKSTITFNEKTKEIVIKGENHDHMKQAKIQFVKFLEFLLGDGQFTNIPIPTVHLLNKLAKSTIAMDTMIESQGAKVIIDREASSILIFDTDPNKVMNAHHILKPKLEGIDTTYAIKLEGQDEYLIPLLIGKKGANINKLRQEAAGCTIEISSTEMTVAIQADDENTLNVGKTIVLDCITRLRKGKVFIVLPTKEITAAFIGKNGSHIKELSEKWKGVDIQVEKNDNDPNTSRIRLFGTDEMHVNDAKLAVEEWINKQQQEVTASLRAKSADTSRQHQLRLSSDQIPTIIGSKGSVIRRLEQQFQCKVDIDRKTSILTIKRGSEENIQKMCDAIYKILSGELDPKTLSKEEGENNSANEGLTKSTAIEHRSTNNGPKISIEAMDNLTAFPSLLPSNSSNKSKDLASDTKSKKNIGNTPSYASVISGASSVQSSIDYHDDTDDSNRGLDQYESTEKSDGNDNAITLHEEHSNIKPIARNQEISDIIAVLENGTVAFLGDIVDE